MPDRFLETDDALHALVEELTRFKSSSEQLSLTRDNVERLVNSTVALTERTAELLGRSQEQLDTMTALADGTEQRVNQVVGEQKALADYLASSLTTVVDRLVTTESSLNTVRAILTNQVGLQLDQVHRLARANRLLLMLVLLLSLVSAGLAGYLIWLTIG